MWLLVAIIPIVKLAQVLVVDNYIVSQVSDGADFVTALFLLEVNSSGAGFLIIIVNVVKKIIIIKRAEN
jgi:hypothetical protein